MVELFPVLTYSRFVIRNLIGNITTFSFMFHYMNLVDCIFWICLLEPFLVMCGFIFPSLRLVKLCCV